MTRLHFRPGLWYPDGVESCDRFAEFYREVGRRVRERRTLLGLTQEQLAERAGLKRASLGSIECGRQAVYVHTLCGLADAVGVQVAELLPQHPSGERVQTSDGRVQSQEELPDKTKAFLQMLLG